MKTGMNKFIMKQARKINDNGDIVCEQTVEVTDKDVQGLDIEPSIEGGYLMIGREGNPGNAIFVSTHNADGTLGSYTSYGVTTFDPSTYQGGVSIKQTDDDNFVALSTAPTSEGPYSFVFKASIGSSDLDWFESVPTVFGALSCSGSGSDIVIDTDENVVVTGRSNIDPSMPTVYTKKLDITTGETIWYNPYTISSGPSEFSFLNSMAKTSDGEFILAGRFTLAEILIIKTDSAGVVPHHLIE